MNFIENFSPNLSILTFFGICAFSLNQQTCQIQLTNLSQIYSLVGSIIFIFIFVLNTYFTQFADKNVEQIFSNVFQIAIIFEVLFTIFIYILLKIILYRNNDQHANFLNQLNEIYLKTFQICEKEFYAKCYVRQKIIVILLMYICNVFFLINLFYDGQLNSIIYSACYFWGMNLTYIIFIYTHYICMSLTNVQHLLIEKIALEITIKNGCGDGTLKQLKFFEVFTVWDMFNDVVVFQYRKTFGSLIHMSMIYNCELSAISLYWLVYNLDIELRLVFKLNFIVTPMVVMYCIVNRLEGLSLQVILSFSIS